MGGGTIDLERREYARLGIASYWLLDVNGPSLRVLELEGAGYVERAFVIGEEPVTVTLPFPITLVPARLVEV